MYEARPKKALTRSQTQILWELSKGEGQKQISIKLQISRRAVEERIRRSKRTLGALTLGQLLFRFAMWISTPSAQDESE